MNRLTQNYQLYTQTERDGRLPALDGARALFVLFVGCYHIWQQSWLTPNISIFGYYTSLDPWLRSGYIWVDAMILISGFCLYLPWARVREEGGAVMRPAAAMSCGTADQMYLALRLAMCRKLLPEDAPLLLDDALVNFDAHRAAAALRVLRAEAEKRQVILFTCRRFEEDI